jgi:hypothetical protein
MSIVSFEYPKKHTGIYQPRVLAVISMPSDSYFGVDIGELDPENQGLFTAKLHSIQESKSKEIEELMLEFDLKHSYRNFLEANMRNISIE